MSDIEQLFAMLNSHVDMLKACEERAARSEEGGHALVPWSGNTYEFSGPPEEERRGGQTASRHAHNVEIVGSTPTPAISLEFAEKFAEGMGCKLWIEEVEQEGTWRTRPPLL